MKPFSRRLFYWTPRVLSILFAIFISLFALDVFDEHLPFPRLMLALLIHLIPTLVLVAALALAWKWEWIGGVGFCALGLLYIVSFAGRFPLLTYVLIAGPALLIGVLFSLNWILRGEIHRRLRPAA